MNSTKIFAWMAAIVMVDGSVCMEARLLLFDFLIGSQSLSKARKIRNSTPLIKRWSMSYLTPYIIRDLKAFRFYSTLYKVIYWLLIPCFCALLSFMIFCTENTSTLTNEFYIIVMIAIGGVFAFPQWPYQSSKYRHRKKSMREKTKRR